MPEHTISCNASTRYSRLLHRRRTSLDLEATFKQIKISQNIKPELCIECQAKKCRCLAFTPGMPCSSASSTPTNISSDHKDIPDLVDNKPLHVLYPPVQSPTDKEADREVAAICRAPVYYQVRSQLTKALILYVSCIRLYRGDKQRKTAMCKFSICAGTTCRTLSYDWQCPTTKIAETFSSLKTYN